MSGISGFKNPDVAALPQVRTDSGIKLPPDVKSFDLTLSGALPDTKGMAPGKVFDLLEKYVRDQGSDELKAAFESGDTFVLNVVDVFGNSLKFVVDSAGHLAWGSVGDTQNSRDKRSGTVSC